MDHQGFDPQRYLESQRALGAEHAKLVPTGDPPADDVYIVVEAGEIVGLVDEKHCNTKTVRLSGGGRVTLDCSNLFAMVPEERAFVLSLLADLETWEHENPSEDA